MSTRKRLNLRRLVLVSIGIGAAVGLMTGILGTFFDISIPPGLMGGIAGVIIALAIAKWRLAEKA